MWNVECHTHDDTTDQSSTWHSQNPTDEDLSKLPPVDASQVTVHDGDTNDSSGDTLSGGNRQTQLSGQEHGNGSSKFHRVAASR